MALPRRSSSGGVAANTATSDADGSKKEEAEAVTNIKVAVRCRPMSTNEKARGEHSCFRIENGTACLESPANPGDIHRYRGVT